MSAVDDLRAYLTDINGIRQQFDSFLDEDIDAIWKQVGVIVDKWNAPAIDWRPVSEDAEKKPSRSHPFFTELYGLDENNRVRNLNWNHRRYSFSEYIDALSHQSPRILWWATHIPGPHRTTSND